MKLIIINGPCGVGKSTISKELSKIIPMSVNINIDELRTFISDYKINQERSLSLVLNMTNRLIEESFKKGYSVIIDKMIFENEGYGEGKDNIIEKFLSTGIKYNVDIFEIILWGEWNTVKNRVLKRGFKKGGTFTLEKAKLFWNGINKFKEKRENSIIINTDNKTGVEVLENVKSKLF